MSSFETTLFDSLRTGIAKLESLRDSANARLRLAKPSYGSPSEIAKSFRWHLAFIRLLLEIRSTIQKIAKIIDDLQPRVFNQSSPDVSQFDRKSGGGFRNAWAESERSRSLKCFRSHLPNVATETEFRKFATRWNLVLDEINVVYGQFCKLYKDIPAYITLKRKLPLGGRNALSVFLAYDSGKLDDTLSCEHEILGWHYVPSQVAENLGQAIRKLVTRNIVEKGGKSPSRKAGREFLGKNNWVHAYSRYAKLRDKFSTECYRSGSGELGNFAPRMIRQIQLNPMGLAHNRDISFKIAGSGIERQHHHNRIATILLERPERIGNSDCYFAPCLASIDGKKTQFGYVLMQANWPDYYHCEPDWFRNASDEERIAATYRASSGFFERQRRELDYALTQKEKQARDRKRVADLIRTIRQLPSFTIADSLSSGNCNAGTIQFINLLGLRYSAAVPTDAQSVSGRDLAKAWMKAKYPQVDRLANVVKVASLKALPPAPADVW